MFTGSEVLLPSAQNLTLYLPTCRAGERLYGMGQHQLADLTKGFTGVLDNLGGQHMDCGNSPGSCHISHPDKHGLGEYNLHGENMEITVSA